MQIYSKIKKQVERRDSEAKILRYGKQKHIIIPEWALKLPTFIDEVIKEEKNQMLTEMISKRLFEGKIDKTVMSELPISESTYYRYKQKFEEKIYQLYIELGYVTREEILRTKITE